SFEPLTGVLIGTRSYGRPVAFLVAGEDRAPLPAATLIDVEPETRSGSGELRFDGGVGTRMVISGETFVVDDVPVESGRRVIIAGEGSRVVVEGAAPPPPPPAISSGPVEPTFPGPLPLVDEVYLAGGTAELSGRVESLYVGTGASASIFEGLTEVPSSMVIDAVLGRLDVFGGTYTARGRQRQVIAHGTRVPPTFSSPAEVETIVEVPSVYGEMVIHDTGSEFSPSELPTVAPGGRLRIEGGFIQDFDSIFGMNSSAVSLIDFGLPRPVIDVEGGDFSLFFPGSGIGLVGYCDLTINDGDFEDVSLVSTIGARTVINGGRFFSAVAGSRVQASDLLPRLDPPSLEIHGGLFARVTNPTLVTGGQPRIVRLTRGAEATVTGGEFVSSLGDSTLAFSLRPSTSTPFVQAGRGQFRFDGQPEVGAILHLVGTSATINGQPIQGLARGGERVVLSDLPGFASRDGSIIEVVLLDGNIVRCSFDTDLLPISADPLGVVDQTLTVQLVEPELPADHDLNGVVNITDLFAYITDFVDPTMPLRADFDGNGVVNITDLFGFIGAFTRVPGSP
ncbi:MAG: GC-type dockerin domain-anchored protein, partial [Planctomycetota bacterium]